MTRGLKFCIQEVEGLYYLCSENKGADQLRGYREADLRLCFRICKKPVFSRCGSNCFSGILLKGSNMFFRALTQPARGFQHLPRNPTNVNAGKNMFDRYYCIKVTKKLILGRYFDALFWHYFVLIFLQHCTQMISIDILVPGPFEHTGNSCSIMAKKWQEFTTWSASLQNVVVVCHLF